MSDVGAPDPAEVAAEGKVKEILEAGEARPSAELPKELQHLPEKRVAQLRRTYARGLLLILTGQLLIADVVFWVFAEEGKNWVLSTAVINTWLAAVVVQVIGVVTVVTLHLFPRRDLAKADRPPQAGSSH